MISRPPVDEYGVLFADQPRVMTAKQVSGVIGFAEKTIFARARAGSIPCKYWFGHPRFLRSEMIEWARLGGLARSRSRKTDLVA